MKNLNFVAGWPRDLVKDDELIAQGLLTVGDAREATERVARLEGALKKALTRIVTERFGSGIASDMEKVDWAKWPEHLMFVEGRIEDLRKALVNA